MGGEGGKGAWGIQWLQLLNVFRSDIKFLDEITGTSLTVQNLEIIPAKVCEKYQTVFIHPADPGRAVR